MSCLDLRPLSEEVKKRAVIASKKKITDKNNNDCRFIIAWPYIARITTIIMPALICWQIAVAALHPPKYEQWTIRSGENPFVTQQLKSETFMEQ